MHICYSFQFTLMTVASRLDELIQQFVAIKIYTDSHECLWDNCVHWFGLPANKKQGIIDMIDILWYLQFLAKRHRLCGSCDTPLSTQMCGWQQSATTLWNVKSFHLLTLGLCTELEGNYINIYRFMLGIMNCKFIIPWFMLQR